MEIRNFAERTLLSESLQEKLTPADQPCTDDAPGKAHRYERPGRPANLQFAARREAPAMPKPGRFPEPKMRGIAHHIMANHELQACEVMAWVLCAFPDAPAEFRHGLVEILHDEQRHTRMHMERAAALGVNFGDLPVNCYIWKKALAFESVLDYVAGLPLVFEGANLDHTIEFAALFDAAGDAKGAAVLRTIHKDEIEHVRFGLEWLRRLKPPHLTDWEAWEAHLHWPLRPQKSVGDDFQKTARQAAGMDEDFIARLEQLLD